MLYYVLSDGRNEDVSLLPADSVVNLPRISLYALIIRDPFPDYLDPVFVNSELFKFSAFLLALLTATVSLFDGKFDVFICDDLLE